MKGTITEFLFNIIQHIQSLFWDSPTRTLSGSNCRESRRTLLRSAWHFGRDAKVVCIIYITITIYIQYLTHYYIMVISVYYINYTLLCDYDHVLLQFNVPTASRFVQICADWGWAVVHPCQTEGLHQQSQGEISKGYSIGSGIILDIERWNLQDLQDQWLDLWLQSCLMLH